MDPSTENPGRASKALPAIAGAIGNTLGGISSSVPVRARMALLGGVLLLGAMIYANAASTSVSFPVTASVVKACTVSTPPVLGFGSYDPNASAPLAATTHFNVACTTGTAYSLGLSAGAGGSVSNRLMTSTSAPAGSNTLSYSLYKDASHTVAWDDSSSASGYTGSGANQPITVYGQVPVRQYGAAPAVDYADTITMTLSY